MLKKWLVTFAVTGLVLAGCGEESSDEPGGGDSTADATSTTTEAPSGDLITADNFGDRVVAAQLDAGGVEMDMEMSVQGQAIQANGVMLSGDTLESTLMQLTMDVPGEGSMEMRLVDGIMYMQIPEMGWVSMNLAELAQTMGMDLNSFDPSAQIEAFNEALVSLEATGEPEEIDGVQAQPYTLVIDNAQLSELEGFEDMPAPAEAEMEVQMWIGPDDLPRRMIMDMEGESVTMNMSNWGTDVSVEAPPADEVQDFSELMGGGGMG